MKRCFLLSALLTLVATMATAQTVTKLSMTSDPGEYIGQGRNYALSTPDVFVTMSANYDQGVNVVVNYHGLLWQLEFAAAGQAQLSTGDYLDAQRWPFQNDPHPGLSVVGEGRGCNEVTGDFSVRYVDYDVSGNPVAFWVTFVQHCEGLVPALRGELIVNVPLTVPVNSTSWGRLKTIYR